MTSYAKISQVAHYAPDQVIYNDDLATIMDTSDEWIRSRTGIQERRISLNENTSDLATNVAYQLLEKSGLSPEELDFVLVARFTPNNSTGYGKGYSKTSRNGLSACNY